MKDKKVKQERLRLVLAETHREKQKEAPKPTMAWRTGVMRSISRLEDSAPRIDQWAVMERLVWRFVPAAGAMALFLAVMVSQVGPDPAAEVASLMSTDTADSVLYTFYQSESANE